MKSRYIGVAAIFMALLMMGTLSVSARVERRFRASAGQNITVIVDSIDYRADLTRLYARLLGRPHTSHRIDGVTLLSNGVTYTARDIDGIDFKRYFQWEDGGVIPVEIDFVKMKPVRSGTITLTTPRGENRIRVTRR